MSPYPRWAAPSCWDDAPAELIPVMKPSPDSASVPRREFPESYGRDDQSTVDAPPSETTDPINRPNATPSFLPARTVSRSRRRLVLAAIALLSALPAQAAPVDFNREIRPILSDKCFNCHGPDESSRKAKLRLDTRAGALLAENATAAITPGRSAESELIFRITSTDPEEVMPPPEAKLGRLTPTEVATLKRWIDEGAGYQSHWSFAPPDLAAQAPTREPAGFTPASSPIDRLVFASLASRQLRPQPEADRLTLIRRLTLDLNGLPPTPSEIAAFVADPTPEAIPRLVDRLLASPRYGERMAADWLDVARYADSYGFQIDRERDMWPWRDWVIEAFNKNLPWDKFVTYQLAGDLLPGATDEQILATAFNRLHPQEAEAGSVEEEYRINHVNDRTTTFGAAFLGLTLECARCHDHKYDPISQREYYSLSAFFQDIDEAGLYPLGPESTPTPTMWLPDDAQRRKHAAATSAVRTAEQALDAARASARGAFERWLTDTPASELKPGGEIARFNFDDGEPAPIPPKDPKAPAVTPNAEAAPAPAPELPPALMRFANAAQPGDYATSPVENQFVPGSSGSAVRFSGDFPLNTTVGNFRRHDPFSAALWLKAPRKEERAVILHRSSAASDSGSRGYELILNEGRLRWSLIHFWPGNAVSIRALDPLPLGQWVHVIVTSDGSSRAAGLRLYLDGQPVRVEIVQDNLTKDITGSRTYNPPEFSPDTLTVGARFRDRAFKDGLVDDLRIFNRAVTELEAADLHRSGALAGAAPEARFDYYLTNHDPAYQQALGSLHAARAAQTDAAEEAREIMVMRQSFQPRTAYVLRRGEYDQRGESVAAGTPEILPPFPASEPRNRLGLARWLTDPRHPLFARVTVNRFWQALFGHGLVKTAEDFGSQGDQPTHPELLDWLAGEFIRSGWDVKALLRTIVLSETYRQRSFATPGIMADDPENTWLARGPRYRLPAEMIRDRSLAASGLLVEKIGGPPVYTYDIPESFKPAPAGKGEDLHRRSVYTFWRRTGPAPVLEAFDMPKRVVCVVRRDTTNTPLQALVLLNGPQFVEASRALAEELYRAHGGQRDRIVAAAFERVLCRPPDAAEREIIIRLFEDQLAVFTADPRGAETYLATGATPRAVGLPPPVTAAVAVVVNTLMNHDEFVMKR